MDNGAAHVVNDTHAPSSRAVPSNGVAQRASEAPTKISRAAPSRVRAHSGSVPLRGASPDAPPISRAQQNRVTQALSDDRAQLPTGIQGHASPVIAEIRALWSMRQRWLKAKNKLVLQGKALCRGFTAGDKAAATKLFASALKGECEDMRIEIALTPFIAAIAHFDRKLEKGDPSLTIGVMEKQLEKYVRQLPYHAWVSTIRGFGDGNLYAVVGEAGDIASYKNPSSLWKRMGLAVINGERQRKCADAELAELHGYYPSRRAVAFNLGECLIRARSPGYYELYLEHKALQMERGLKKVHAHRRAARFMTKRVLLDLWIEATRERRSSTETICAVRPVLPRLNGGGGAQGRAETQGNHSPIAS